MTEYRLDLLDNYGRLLVSVKLNYDSDADAEAEVAGALRGAPAKLWRGGVLIREFTREPPR